MPSTAIRVLPHAVHLLRLGRVRTKEPTGKVQGRILSATVSRKQRGSKNRRKAKMQRARLHRRIRNQRRDFLHQATTELEKTKPVLVVEDPGSIPHQSCARTVVQ